MQPLTRQRARKMARMLPCLLALSLAAYGEDLAGSSIPLTVNSPPLKGIEQPVNVPQKVTPKAAPMLSTSAVDTVESETLQMETVSLQDTEATPVASDQTMHATDLTAAPPPADPPLLLRRTPAPAIDSLPFPNGEWQIGGTSVIGAPDTRSDYLIMNALKHTELGKFLADNRIKIYGWVNVGGNVSSSKHSNYPVTYNTFARRVDLDQVALTIERIPDTVQTEHIDWGFRVTGFYGIDYRLTTMKGIFSDQLLEKNRQYGFDPVLFYGDLYIPKIAQGMNIRFGRYLSVPDIEAQLCPDNYTYTHSLLYGVDPYTQMGILTTTKLNSQFTVQLGINGGNDISLFAGNRAKLLKPTGVAMLQWIAPNNKDSIYAGVNAINDGKFAYNNLQHFVGTWSHVFTPKIHTKTEAYYMYQKKVPGIGFAPEWAIVNYLEFQLSKKNYITIRNEYYDDIKGQRYGVKNKMTSHTLGFTHWFTPSIGLRPEFRFDQAYNNPSYDNGRKKSQFLGSMDLLYRF